MSDWSRGRVDLQGGRNAALCGQKNWIYAKKRGVAIQLHCTIYKEGEEHTALFV